ncbi:2-octaprenyl-3-methyl-6-methoxy-1,4-benzoquinol hydroxylase [Sulfuritortus calidifontis]|uniref:2-octaprenyl-3-methyl-6-methoxy-1,4-benzoquinol hydroxylase n=1 Tax=Sulfuritortus calidifontis TaxID=1914471 RepID=A0A4R3JWH9_9PROT|nr:UbiH/UbiF family hydroxylase [Sulfuritortus calidifontis]TCS72625.1 2-octaprenyl-3-methyl-6-methoxy-1,4-benzoquinol hydroxylase [Sulfuritortus calidifontis]
MSERNAFDVVIVGGGLAGAAFALALRATAWRVALVEPRPPRDPGEDWDARVYAYSPANVAWLRELGAWDATVRNQPVHAMRIAGDAGGHLVFDALDAGLPELAFIAESKRLHHALWQGLRAAGNIDLVVAETAAVVWGATEHELVLADGRRLQAGLLVGADGAHSWLRTQANIGLALEDYHHVGVVANFECERPHRGIAYQWFRHDGVLAYLPLPGQRVSIVWSTTPEQAEALMALPAQAFAAEVAAAGRQRLGALRLVTSPQGFPLKRRRAEEWVRPGLVLIGDAAHTVHPLAGQGINLGFRDARMLAHALHDTQRAPGDLGRLQAYALRRDEDVRSVQLVTGGLKKLFGSEDGLVRWLRNTGLSMTDSQNWLKQALMRHAIQ